MRRLQDTKAVYAQSSDIKSRTYLEYRRDMKKKAIAELEVKEWFEKKLKQMHDTNQVTVKKVAEMLIFGLIEAVKFQASRITRLS